MRCLLAMFLMIGPALADEAQDAINAAGFRLATTYHCAPVLKDDAPWEWAKSNAAELLAAAGVSSPTAAEMIAATEDQERGNPAIAPDLCRDLIAAFQ